MSQAERYLAISGPNALAFKLPPGYDGVIRECATPEAISKIQEALSALLRRPIRVQFEESGPQADRPPASVANPGKGRDHLETDPMVRKVVELFEARPLHLEYDEES